MSKTISWLAALLSGAALAFTLAAQEHGTGTQQPTAATIHEDVRYGSVNGSELLLDVYEPTGAATDAHPAVVLIHGGGWTRLNKSTMRGMGQFLARSGFVAFSVNYRLFQANQNRWPAQLDDVQRAVRWVRVNASKYDVNPERVGAFGHSSGAQLAALLGMEDTRDNSDTALAKYSSKVQAVVDVSGPVDFTVDRDPQDVRFLTDMFGTDYSKHPEVWRDASPLFHVSKGDAPFLIVHGTRIKTFPSRNRKNFTRNCGRRECPRPL